MKSPIVLSVLLVLSLSVTIPAHANLSRTGGSLSGKAVTRDKATKLFDIAIERSVGETIVHLKADGAISAYREARLKKNAAAGRPDRMYLDLKNLRLARPIPVKKVGTALLRVRNALRADGIRVVFDSGLDNLFQYTISEEPDGLLVTIREPSDDHPVIAEIAQPVEPEPVVVPTEEMIRPVPKGAGDLDLVIVASDTPEQAEEWLNSSSYVNGSLQILRRVKPDQVINTSFLVTGVSPDSNGDFSVAVSFTLLDPNGKPVLSERRYATTSGHAPVWPSFVMAKPMLAIVLDENDPAGEYKIICLVEDLTNDKLVRTSLGITLEK